MKEGVYIPVHDRLNEEDGEVIGKKIKLDDEVIFRENKARLARTREHT